MYSDEFNPANTIDAKQLKSLVNAEAIKVAGNNMAFNPNDKTSIRNIKN